MRSSTSRQPPFSAVNRYRHSTPLAARNANTFPRSDSVTIAGEGHLRPRSLLSPRNNAPLPPGREPPSFVALGTPLTHPCDIADHVPDAFWIGSDVSRGPILGGNRHECTSITRPPRALHG